MNETLLQSVKDRSGKLEILCKRKRSKLIGIMPGVVPYDLLEDLRKLKAHRSIKQLLSIAPNCRTSVKSSLLRKMLKPIVNEVTVSSDPSASIVDVVIDGIVLRGVQTSTVDPLLTS